MAREGFLEVRQRERAGVALGLLAACSYTISLTAGARRFTVSDDGLRTVTRAGTIKEWR